jgi:predicted site-specific integrase-resolvase
MKANEVLKILKICRQTLSNYVKSGKIKVTKLRNGYYDYDDESVYSFLNITLERKNIIYARVSTYKQKVDLSNQVTQLINYCNINKIKYDKVYQEINSGVDFDRNEFTDIVNDVINKKINNIYITHKDRLSRLSFLTLENMFNQFGTKIIVINDIDNNNSLDDDLFEELINIIHVFSTKMYSKRRSTNVKKALSKITI